MPVAMPTWRKVLLAPEAMPLRWGGTTEMADEASTGLTVPIPMPATMKPGSRTVHPEEAWVVAMSRQPTAIRRRPVPEEVSGVDPHGQLAGERGHDEGEHGDGQEADPGGQRSVAQVVLDVEGQVQEQGEDRRGDGEGGQRDAHHGRPLEQGQVEHGVVLSPLGHEEDDQKDRRSDQQPEDQGAVPTRRRCHGPGRRPA